MADIFFSIAAVAMNLRKLNELKSNLQDLRFEIRNSKFKTHIAMNPNSRVFFRIRNSQIILKNSK